MYSSTKLYNYDFSMPKTYAFALVFVAGNVLLPILIHAIPNGGPTFLPIYFFTLIGAYKYGIRVGLLTACLSPIVSHLLVGMPMLSFLPVLLIKSTLLAVAAAYMARLRPTITILNLVLVVLSYQLVGALAEWLIVKDLMLAIQDFRVGFPGILIQIGGGYLVLKALQKL